MDQQVKTLVNAKMWAINGDAYIPCENSIDKLLPGRYVIEHDSNQGICFSKRNVTLDHLVPLADSAAAEVVAEIEKFWSSEAQYRKYKVLWKRGILIFGPPGSGKTTTVQLVSNMIIDNGGISVYVDNPKAAAAGLHMFRKIEPTRPILVVIEDIDTVAKSDRHEGSLLALLDGELQIDNVVFIATTNYPEELDRRIVNRPSRFDIVKMIGMPSDESRRQYLLAKDPEMTAGSQELEDWVAATKGFSIAHLKELILSVRCMGHDMKASADRLKAMSKPVSSKTHGGGF